MAKLTTTNESYYLKLFFKGEHFTLSRLCMSN